MSDELDKAIQDFNEPKPRPDYTPMVDAFAEPKPEEKTYGSDFGSIKEAAKDVDEQRAAAQPEPIVRQYQQVRDGQFTGEEVPGNETVDLKRAAEDITRARGFEAEALELQTDATVADAVDTVRSSVQEQLQGQQPQQAQPQQPEYPQQPQQSPEVQAQQQQQQQAPVSDEQMLQDALSRPAVRQALEAQLQTVEAQRQQYAQAAQDAANLAHAGLLGQFPELQHATASNLPAILNVLQANNPQRYAQVIQGLLQTDHLQKAAANAKSAEQQIAQARVKTWAAEQDSVMDHFVAQQPKEESSAVSKNLARVVRDYYGINPAELAQAIQANPALRAAPFQRMMYETVRGHLTQEAIQQKRVIPQAPPVQRPGASREAPSYSDEDAASALKAFNRNPNPKTAATYLNAKRAARR